MGGTWTRRTCDHLLVRALSQFSRFMFSYILSDLREVLRFAISISILDRGIFHFLSIGHIYLTFYHLLNCSLIDYITLMQIAFIFYISQSQSFSLSVIVTLLMHKMDSMRTFSLINKAPRGYFSLGHLLPMNSEKRIV